MGFKAQKKLITREKECFTRVGRSRANDCGEVVCQEQTILDLLVESSISVGRSCEMIDWQTSACWKQVEGKYTDDLRNEFCWVV